MRSETFQAGDKVVLHPHWMPADVKVRPRVKRRCLYCVRRTYLAEAVHDARGERMLFVWLVGARGRRSVNGGEMAVPAEAFQRVAAAAHQPKGGA